LNNQAKRADMILNDEEMRSIVELLLQRTRENRLDWRHEHGQLSTTLPNRTTVEVGRDDRSLDFTFTLRDDAGILLGQMKAPAEGSVPSVSPQLRELYDRALQRAGKSIYLEIVDALKITGSAAVTVTTTTPPPPQVTDQQAVAVLKKMAGQWDLDYGRGKERVTIRDDGTYVIDKSTEPKFKLKVLAWNEDKGTAEVAKDSYATGKRLQIEFLTSSEDAMVGHAKHDMHKLVYKLVDKSV
jgi:hypothetical protein